MFQCFRYVVSLLSCVFAFAASASDYQKPGAPVGLADTAAIALVQNEARSVSIRFLLKADVDRLRIHVHPSKDLRILSSQTSWVFSGGIVDPKAELEISAPNAGEFPLMFSVVTEQGDTTMSRVLGPRISVNSTEKTLAKAPAQKTEAEKIRTLDSGRRIHWVPAQSP